jgi:hypothetical protein
MNRLYWLPAILCVFLTGCWFSMSPAGPAGKGSRTSTGTLGKYQFASRSEVKAFNSKIGAWWSERGFVPYTDKTYDAIVGGKNGNWKEPGLLLCRSYDAKNRIFVFIPEWHLPNKNMQMIGSHLELQGDLDEINKHDKEFESERKSFHKAFPSTVADPP